MSRLRRSLPWVGPLVLAGLLRLPGLARRPLWYDEAFSLLLARRPTESILVGTAADTMPPGYYLLLRVWSLVSTEIGWLRLINVLLGLALVGLVYLLAKELIGRREAGWAAVLAAISPLLIYHAQELRMYTLLAVGLTGHVVCVVRAVGRPPGKAAWAAATAFAAVALYAHNLAVFSLAALPTYAMLRRDRVLLRRLLLTLGLAAVLFLPWLVVVPGQVAKIQAAFWTPRPGLLEIVQVVAGFHTAFPLSDVGLLVGVGASLMAALLTVVVLLRRRPPEGGVGLLVALVVVPALLLLAASWLMRPLFLARAMLLPLVGYLILAARAIVAARPPALGWTIAIAFIVAAAIGLPAQAGHQTFPRSPFPHAVEFLRQTRLDGDVVVHDNKLSYFPMVVYGPDLEQAYLPDPAGSHNDTLALASAQALEHLPSASIAQASGGARRVRFVVFTRAFDEYAALGQALPPAMDWLEANGRRSGESTFNDLRIYDYLIGG